MAVTVDRVGQNIHALTNVTTITYTMGGLGVGTGPNSALIVVASFSGPNQASVTSAIWDSTGSNQAMSLLIDTNDASANNGTTWIFGLLNPVPGNKALTLTWTGASQVTLAAISFNGVRQDGILNAFPGQNPAVGGPGTISVTVPSATGDMAVAVASVPTGISNPNQNSIFIDTATPDTGAAQYAVGNPAGVTFSWSAAAFGCCVAIDIAADTVPRAPILSKPTQPISSAPLITRNQALLSGTVITAPFGPYDLSDGPFRVYAYRVDASRSLNPNLFTNPIPFGPYDYSDGPWKVRPPRIDASQGLNPNLFTNPIPFGPYDLSDGPWRVPRVRSDTVSAAPPLTLTANLGPFTQEDFSKPFDIPSVPGLPQQPNYANFYPNPQPFAQYDWSKPFRLPSVPGLPQQPNYVNFYPNPIPFALYDWSKPSPVKSALDLTTQGPPITLTAQLTPFFPLDWSKPYQQAPVKVAPVDALNINLFTNPIPFAQFDWSKPVRQGPSQPHPLQPSIALYSGPVPSPFIPLDWSKPFFPRPTVDATTQTNLNLFTNPIPFAQYDWSKPAPFGHAPQAPTATPLVLFANLGPWTQVDFSKPWTIRAAAPIVTQSNIALTTVVAVPFIPIDMSDSSFPAPRPPPVQSPNIALQPNPVPFAQFSWPLQFTAPRAPTDKSLGLNPNLFQNQIPFALRDWPKLVPQPPRAPDQIYPTIQFHPPAPQPTKKRDTHDWIPKRKHRPTVYDKEYYEALRKDLIDTVGEIVDDAGDSISIEELLPVEPSPNWFIPLNEWVPLLHPIVLPTLTRGPSPYTMPQTPEEMAADDAMIIAMLLEE